MSAMHAPLPPGPFGCILADPPWRFDTFSDAGRDRCPDAVMTRARQRENTPERHYQTMTLADIAAMPVASVAARDCVLLMWVVDPLLPQAIEIGRAWGFEYKTVGFTWAKMRRETSRRGFEQDLPERAAFPMGTGYWTRANPEQCLLFTRGAPKRVEAGVCQLLVSPRREHSRKPDEQYDRIMRLTRGPYLELFARQAWPVGGWTAWGNQVGRFSPEVAA